MSATIAICQREEEHKQKKKKKKKKKATSEPDILNWIVWVC